MEFWLQITWLNDFIFYPYSVYLHQIYNKGKEEVYHGIKQSKGKRHHDFIEQNEQADSMVNAYVYSSNLRIYGKVDVFEVQTGKLVEYKSKASTIYRGYYYQIWSQYICLLEMGFSIHWIGFFDFKSFEYREIPPPNFDELEELKYHIKQVREYDFESPFQANPNKCAHCIYSELCDNANLNIHAHP